MLKKKVQPTLKARTLDQQGHQLVIPSRAIESIPEEVFERYTSPHSLGTECNSEPQAS